MHVAYVIYFLAHKTMVTISIILSLLIIIYF